jgi:hypothetical protein
MYTTNRNASWWLMVSLAFKHTMHGLVAAMNVYGIGS